MSSSLTMNQRIKAIKNLSNKDAMVKSLAQSFLQQVRITNEVQYDKDLITLIFQKFKEDTVLTQHCCKLLLKILASEEIKVGEMEDFITLTFQEFLLAYVDDPFEENQKLIIEVSTQLIKLFQQDLGNLLFTDPELLNEKKMLLIKNLVTQESIEISDNIAWVKSVILSNKFQLGLPIFYEMVNLMDYSEDLQDILDAIYEKEDFEQTIEFYLSLSEIEPRLFQKHLKGLIESLTKMYSLKKFMSDGLMKKSVLYVIGNTLEVECKCLSFNDIKTVLLACNMALKNILLSICKESNLNELTLNRQVSENQQLAPAQYLMNEAKRVIQFMYKLITRLDRNYEGEDLKKPCLGILVNIVQNLLMKDSDLDRRCSILQLQVLSQYLDGSEIKEIQPLVNMLIEFSKYFTDQAIILTSMQVLSFIINKSDTKLFQLYGDQLLKYYGFQYFIEQKNKNIQRQAFIGLTSLLRESIFAHDLEKGPHEKKEKQAQDKVSNISLDVEVLSKIGQEIIQILSKEGKKYWVLIDLEYILINLVKPLQVNQICMLVMDIYSEKVPNLIAKAARFHQIEQKVIIKFNHLMKNFIQNRDFTLEIIMAYQEFTNNNLLSQYWKKQKVLNITLKLIQMQFEFISSINLEFDIDNQEEKRLVKLSKLLKHTLILERDIFKIEEQFCIRTKDLEIFLDLIRKVQELPTQLRLLILITSSIIPNILHLYKLQDQEELMDYLFCFGLTYKGFLKKKKAKVLDVIITIFKDNAMGQLHELLKSKILVYSNILFQQLMSSLKFEDNQYNKKVIKTVNKIIKFYPDLSISLQNILFNEYIPLALKEDQPITDFKRYSLKLLGNMCTYSPSSIKKVVGPLMEVFEKYLLSGQSFHLRYESLKGLNSLICKEHQLAKAKSLPNLLKGIQDLLIQNQEHLDIQPVVNSQLLMMEILAYIFKLIVREELAQHGLNPQWQKGLNLATLQNLLSLWLNNLLLFEEIDHINFPLVETFIEILTSKEENRKILIGKKNENIVLVLKLISIALDWYCFDQEEVEDKVRLIVFNLNRELKLQFVVALGRLTHHENWVINNLIKTVRLNESDMNEASHETENENLDEHYQVQLREGEQEEEKQQSS